MQTHRLGTRSVDALIPVRPVACAACGGRITAERVLRGELKARLPATVLGGAATLPKALGGAATLPKAGAAALYCVRGDSVGGGDLHEPQRSADQRSASGRPPFGPTNAP